MFDFDLQVLLEARHASEERKQTALAQAVRELEVQNGLLEEIRNKRRRMIREYYALGGQAVESLRLILYSENIVLCRDRELGQLEQCRLADREVEDKRLALIEASKQRKMIEKLKEKKFTEYQQELNSRESKELDEAALLRYGGGLS